MIRKITLYINTVKHFTVNQVFYLVLNKIKRVKHHPGNRSEFYIKQKLNLHIKPCAGIKNENKVFTFIDHTVNYNNKIMWNDQDQEKLWLYNLHYFDYLIPLCSKISVENYLYAKSLIVDWIINNPIGHGNGWEPYPIALRMVNWIFFCDAFFEEVEKDAEFNAQFLSSLALQYSFLSKRIEYNLQANHLFTNIKSMLFTAFYINDIKGIKKYSKQLLKQIREQIDNDGGHYEKSPMYHCLILTDLLDILNVIYAQHNAPEPYQNSFITNIKEGEIEPVADKMLRWIINICQPDGNIPLLGDSAFNIAPKIKDILDYYEAISGKECKHQVQPGLTSLTESGYHVFRTNDQYLIFDTGELGVSYQPGHAHCDILSFEYSYNKKRFIVDSGIGNYLDSDLRRMSRSIKAHNTVIVNDQDQAQLWKAFRMGKRVEKVRSETRINSVTGYYTNNMSYRNSYTHCRQITLVENKYFLIEDTIKGRNIKSLNFLFHFHPDVTVNDDDNSVVLMSDNYRVVLEWYDSLTYTFQDALYMPEFGKIQNSKVMILDAQLYQNTFKFKIIPAV